MGKLTISMAIFNSFLYVYQRVNRDGTKHYQRIHSRKYPYPLKRKRFLEDTMDM
jgi:hypothetical protein